MLRDYAFLWALLLFMLFVLIFGVHAAYSQDILNPPTGTYSFQWDHDGKLTDHYELQINPSAPWINVGKPSPLSVPVPELTIGTYLVDVRACVDKVITSTCTSSNRALPLTVVPVTLPSAWTARDIGTVGAVGSSAFASGVFTVRARSGDIWNAVDSFRYLEQPLVGDVDIVTQVRSLEKTSLYAKAGVMMRASDAPGAANVVLVTLPDFSHQFLTRQRPDVPAVSIAEAKLNAHWLKLSRRGNTITGSVSLDGATWTRLGATDLPGLTSVGLVLTSNNQAAVNTSTFDSVTITSGAAITAPAPPTNPVTK